MAMHMHTGIIISLVIILYRLCILCLGIYNINCIISYYCCVGGCEAIINGPFNHEDLSPWSQLSSLDVNETYPAVVRCKVTCLNQQGFYHPAMALIITSQEEFIPFLYYVDRVDAYSSNGLYFEIHYKNVSYCNVQNNYTMEFEYLIYSNTSKIDRSVVTCGIQFSVYPNQTDDVCWGDTFGIVRYNGPELVSVVPSVPPPLSTANLTPELILSEARNLSHVFVDWNVPAQIICETTCNQTDVCDPVLRLDIPGQTLNEESLIKYLPRENYVSELYSLRDFDISRKWRNTVVAKYIITPRSTMFHKIIATCQWSYNYSVTPEVLNWEVYYILFQSCSDFFYI